MRILLNIGNTHSQFALETAQGVGKISTLNSRELCAELAVLLAQQATDDWQMLAACVVPALRQALQERFGRQIAFVSCESYPQINFERYDTRTLGADRIANVAAAVDWRPGAKLILDCGTAITSEAVSAEAEFFGGVILPGRAMQRRGLGTFTAQLPEIALEDDFPPALGTTTVQAIKAGVDLGALGAVKEIIARTHTIPEFAECEVLAIGGDAPFFVKNIPGLLAGPADFTLRGVRLAQV